VAGKGTRIGLGVVAAAVLAVSTTAGAVASPPDGTGHHRSGVSTGLPLGAPDLPETRTTTSLQPGVTLTTIFRGVADTTDTWTVEVSSADTSNPDPDAPKVAITDKTEAEQTAASLTGAGLSPRVEAVRTPRTADTGGLLGYRVRVGSFASQADAASTAAQVSAAGYGASTVYTGWDDDAGAPPTRGPWHLDVLTIDPKRFTGRLAGDYGPDFVNRETTSSLARGAGATAAINAGFFVLDPAAGAPGDPAGVGVYQGRLESETTNGRPALLVHDNTARAAIVRLWWHGSVTGAHGDSLALSGLNRVPGLIRNCGEPGDSPLSRPQQDVTCTKSAEIVAFDKAYGATTPSGSGAEVVLNARGKIVSVNTSRGTTVPAGGHTIQAIGSAAGRLLALARRSTSLSVHSALYRRNGSRLHLRSDESIFNGAPVLVLRGKVHATPNRDGAVHPGQPSFYYGWAHKRNPRTFAGIDRHGRLVLVTCDGRSTNSLGLSISETAAVAHALGMRKAMNLDGGGSTTMVVNGSVINAPSDATGERPIGDALEILP
jgi:Phosphodiester glycosidase/SPOR domain